MKALTLIQPWATAIISMGKDIENRPWAPPRSLVGQRFAIHAGKKFDKNDAWNLMQELGHPQGPYPQGVFLGTVELAGCVRLDGVQAPALFDENEMSASGLTSLQVSDAMESRWRAPGAKFLWVLRSPVALAEPLPWPGALGLWNVPEEIASKLVTP